ncbi:MAG: M20/M25/M40 family metallo-hydrolase [Candidatus Pristimantibacillus sp.]
MKTNYTLTNVNSERNKKLRIWGRRILIPVIVASSILIGLLQIQSTPPAELNAPDDHFSAERAMEKLYIIAKEPHPLNSPAHDDVRDYLLSELQALGLNPEIQKTDALSDLSGRSGVIENIITRIPGTDNSKAVMIAAHYDSVPSAQGAADDGAGIAAMLETARAVQASGSLKNDLILLMTDGEEMGLLGAKAFMKEHPWAQEVGLVLNFEARGNKGPSFMFETSDENGWLIEQFIKAAPQPIAYSLIYNVYKLMPNDTDLTMFREGGMAGLNFAFGMGLDAYHQPLDTPENLDRSSLQHHGEYMLSLTKHFGQLDLSQVKQENRVYFNLFGENMVHYPESWAIWLVLLGAIMFVATLWYGIRLKRINLKGLAGGFLITLLSVGIIYGLITLLWNLIRSNTSSSKYSSILLDSHISIYYLFGLLLVTISVAWLLIRWVSRYIRAENIWIGSLLLWLLLSIGTALYLPGGSYLFIWPLIISLVGLNMSFQLSKGAWIWTSTLFAVPGFLLFAPICFLVYIMMTLDMAGALMTVVALAFTLIYPVYVRKKE